MAGDPIHKNIQLPLVIKPKWLAQVSVFLGLLLSALPTAALLKFWSENPVWASGLGLGIVALFDIWIISNLATITVHDDGMKYGIYGLTYSSIPWESIRKVVYQESGDVQNRQPRFYVYHEGSFLGLPAGINIYMYRRDDLAAVLSALRQHTQHVKFSMGR